MQRTSKLFRVEAVETRTAKFDAAGLGEMCGGLCWVGTQLLPAQTLLSVGNATDSIALINAFLSTVASMSTNYLFAALYLQQHFLDAVVESAWRTPTLFTWRNLDLYMGDLLCDCCVSAFCRILGVLMCDSYSLS